MRLKSAIWVAAYIRRCHIEGAFAAVRRRGAEEAGAIFVKLNRLDGTAELFGPAPQSVFDDARPSDRLFIRCLGEGPAPEAKVEERYTRTDHNHMQFVVTVDDPKIFTKPFVLAWNEYRWIPDQEAEEQLCVPSDMINYMRLLSDPASRSSSTSPR